MNVSRIILAITVTFSSIISWSQEKSIFLDRKKIDRWQTEDSAKFQYQLQTHRTNLWNDGYLFAGIDSISSSGVYFHSGKKYLLNGSSSGRRKIIRSARKSFGDYINRGYPFARLRWDSVAIQNGELFTSFSIDPGPLISFDTIVFINNIKTKKSYLEQSLDIVEGSLFSESAFQSISKKLSRIEFLSEKSSPDISFQSSKANVYLDLEESTTGSFQGVLGVLPNQSSNSQPLFIGSLDLSLLNLFRTGKKLTFSWNRYAELSQLLDVSYAHPFFLGSNLSLETDLNVLKQDSSFLKGHYSFGVNWFIGASSTFGVSYERETSDILLSDGNRIEEQGLLDFDQNWYGVKFQTGGLNDESFSNFMSAKISLEIGERSVSQNTNLIADYYDSIQLESSLGRLLASLEFQHILNNQFAIYSNFKIGHFSGQQISRNQLFRLGGLRSLRGFNEQFYFAESYLVNQLEIRMFFEKKSYLFTFWDQGFVKMNGTDWPTGIGLGLSLDTTSGLFSFAMAVGANQNLPFDVSAAKIHFGYLSRF